jgi:hypothetical protein
MKYLSDYILSAYCEDVVSGASHQNGKVFEVMGRFSADEDLEWLNFWDKLAAKATATGSVRLLEKGPHVTHVQPIESTFLLIESSSRALYRFA